MAKPKSEPTAAQKAAAAASEKLKKAREAAAKNNNDATKAAVTKAAGELAAARKIKNRESYVRIVNPRLASVVAGLNTLSKLALPNSYEYGEGDIATMEKVIMEAATNCVTVFKNSKLASKAKDASAKPSFIS